MSEEDGKIREHKKTFFQTIFSFSKRLQVLILVVNFSIVERKRKH